MAATKDRAKLRTKALVFEVNEVKELAMAVPVWPLLLAPMPKLRVEQGGLPLN